MTVNYNPVDQSIINKLSGILGDKYVIFGDEQQLEPFSHDEIPDRRYARMRGEPTTSTRRSGPTDSSMRVTR